MRLPISNATMGAQKGRAPAQCGTFVLLYLQTVTPRGIFRQEASSCAASPCNSLPISTDPRSRRHTALRSSATRERGPLRQPVQTRISQDQSNSLIPLRNIDLPLPIAWMISRDTLSVFSVFLDAMDSYCESGWCLGNLIVLLALFVISVLLGLRRSLERLAKEAIPFR